MQVGVSELGLELSKEWELELGWVQAQGSVLASARRAPIEQDSPEAELSLFPSAFGYYEMIRRFQGGARLEDRNLDKILLQILTLRLANENGPNIVVFIYYYVMEGIS